MNYYNDNDPFVAAWLSKLIEAGELPDGSVDTRSIVDVVPADLGSFRQLHFFAGIGGWAHALELARWPEDREIWTASLPCQPLSVAGARQGALDGRHLWPAFHRLVAVCRPAVIVGEQVAGADGHEWFAGVRFDLEELGYACGAAVMPACAVGAPHRRERLYWCAVAQPSGEGSGDIDRSLGDEGWQAVGAWTARLRPGDGAHMRDGAGSTSGGGRDVAGCGDGGEGDAAEPRLQRSAGETISGSGGLPKKCPERCEHSFWDNAEWRIGADGKARRVEPGICLLADGFPNRVGLLRGFGNAIVPQVAAQFIRALM